MFKTELLTLPSKSLAQRLPQISKWHHHSCSCSSQKVRGHLISFFPSPYTSNLSACLVDFISKHILSLFTFLHPLFLHQSILLCNSSMRYVSMFLNHQKIAFPWFQHSSGFLCAHNPQGSVSELAPVLPLGLLPFPCIITYASALCSSNMLSSFLP